MKIKKILILAGCFLICMIGGVFGWSFAETEKLLRGPKFEIKEIAPSQLTQEWEKINIKVSEKESISAYFLAGKKDISVIFIPGWGMVKEHFLIENANSGFLESFREKGYGIVLFDPRGIGESKGEYLFGTHMDEDVILLMENLKKERGQKKFVLIGFSLGANTALRTATKKSEDILAVIADGAFVSVFHTKIYPRFLLLFLKLAVFLRGKGQVLNALDLSKLPLEKLNNVFLIAGKEDIVTPLEESEYILKRVKEPKYLWIIEGGHCEGWQKYQKEYLEKIFWFLEEAERPLYFFKKIVHNKNIKVAPVAQLDRAPGFGPGGLRVRILPGAFKKF